MSEKREREGKRESERKEEREERKEERKGSIRISAASPVTAACRVSLGACSQDGPAGGRRMQKASVDTCPPLQWVP